MVQDVASIISGGQAPVMKAFSGTEGAVTPGNVAGGVMAAMETSSHSHGGNVKEDFVSYYVPEVLEPRLIADERYVRHSAGCTATCPCLWLVHSELRD